MFWWFHFVETVKKMLIYSFIHSCLSILVHFWEAPFFTSIHSFSTLEKLPLWDLSMSLFSIKANLVFLMSRSRNSFTNSRSIFFTKSSIGSFFDSLHRLSMQIKPTRYYLGWDWFSNTQFVHQFVMKNYPSTDSIYPLAKVNQLKIVTDYLHAP